MLEWGGILQLDIYQKSEGTWPGTGKADVSGATIWRILTQHNQTQPNLTYNQGYINQVAHSRRETDDNAEFSCSVPLAAAASRAGQAAGRSPARMLFPYAAPRIFDSIIMLFLNFYEHQDSHVFRIVWAIAYNWQN